MTVASVLLTLALLVLVLVLESSAETLAESSVVAASVPVLLVLVADADHAVASFADSSAEFVACSQVADAAQLLLLAVADATKVEKLDATPCVDVFNPGSILV